MSGIKLKIMVQACKIRMAALTEEDKNQIRA